MLRIENQSKQTILGECIHQTQGFKERLVGLLGHSKLETGHGMWFSPCTSVHTLFMRFSIDVVFLGPDQRVLKTYAPLKPFRLSSFVSKAHAVLELPEGTLEKTDTQVGDQLHVRGLA